MADGPVSPESSEVSVVQESNKTSQGHHTLEQNLAERAKEFESPEFWARSKAVDGWVATLISSTPQDQKTFDELKPKAEKFKEQTSYLQPEQQTPEAVGRARKRSGFSQEEQAQLTEIQRRFNNDWLRAYLPVQVTELTVDLGLVMRRMAGGQDFEKAESAIKGGDLRAIYRALDNQGNMLQAELAPYERVLLEGFLFPSGGATKEEAASMAYDLNTSREEKGRMASHYQRQARSIYRTLKALVENEFVPVEAQSEFQKACMEAKFEHVPTWKEILANPQTPPASTIGQPTA